MGPKSQYYLPSILQIYGQFRLSLGILWPSQPIASDYLINISALPTPESAQIGNLFHILYYRPFLFDLNPAVRHLFQLGREMPQISRLPSQSIPL